LRPDAESVTQDAHTPQGNAQGAGVAQMRRTEVRIGISGWNYAGWRNVFYPKDLPNRCELVFASRVLNSIEINGSFYSLQRPTSYRRWYEATPENFLFSVKGARFITHMKKLREVEVPLANFFASGVLALGKKLGPILWQFPPNFGWNAERFREFFQLLPRSTKEAALLGRRHDSKLKVRAWLKTERDRPLRHCVEIRHPSFLVSDFFELLRNFNVAFVFGDSESALDWWSARLELWRQGRHPRDAKLVTAKTKPQRRDVFVYFDNDAKVHAPFDAQMLARKMK
jgi:uncharacterized protein YecE (DUF72 family)